MTKIALISGSSVSKAILTRIHNALMPWGQKDLTMDFFSLDYETIQHNGLTGWPLDQLTAVLQYPLVIRGHLDNPFHRPISPERILAQAQSVHTQIQAFFSPRQFHFFVISPPKETAFSPAMGGQFSPVHEASFHAALELAMAYDMTHVHKVESPCVPCLSAYPRLKINTLSSTEILHKILHAPHTLQVIYTSSPYGQFLGDMMQSYYSHQLATAGVELSPNSIIFSFPERDAKVSASLMMTLILRYLSYSKAAQHLENILTLSFQEIQDMSDEALEHQWMAFAERPDKRRPFQQLARQYYDLSSPQISILGFDVMVRPTSSLHDMGRSLEEMTASHPFYLESIAHKNLKLYPLSPFLPNFDGTWCCRFLTRHMPLKGAMVCAFLERFSCLYSWTDVALLYELEGKKNFTPFLSWE